VLGVRHHRVRVGLFHGGPPSESLAKLTILA
jgi:hypothetical protein